MQKYIRTAIKKHINNSSPAGEKPAVNVDVRMIVTSTGVLSMAVDWQVMEVL